MSLVNINWKPDNRQLRQFGVAGLIVLGAIGTWIFFTHKFWVDMTPQTAARTAYILWGICAALGLLAAAAPPVLKPIYLALTIVSLPIGWIISHVVLVMLFYLVITPLGLFFRVMGRDPLQRTLEPDAPSYWERRPVVTDPKRYYRQA
ncbi:MAG: hypothetical protein DCC65_13240 [Planctomycetota bacterium]|nr:MAG: hypothetical protein DCC65_13240 [Planctomycetota bacterium]